MRLALLLALLFFVTNTYSQEILKKRYYVGGKYNKIILKKDSVVYFKNLSSKEQKKLEKKFPPNTTVKTTTVEKINGKEFSIEKMLTYDSDFFDSLKISKPVNLDTSMVKAALLFEKEKIFVNPWKKNNKEIYYLTFENRQSIKVKFFEWTINTLTIPIKYRPEKTGRYKEDFSSKFNANLFGGISVGNTNFFHRKKVGNKTSHRKLTFGVLIGGSTVTLNKSNTSNAEEAVTEDINKGLLSSRTQLFV